MKKLKLDNPPMPDGLPSTPRDMIKEILYLRKEYFSAKKRISVLTRAVKKNSNAVKKLLAANKSLSEFNEPTKAAKKSQWKNNEIVKGGWQFKRWFFAKNELLAVNTPKDANFCIIRIRCGIGHPWHDIIKGNDYEKAPDESWDAFCDAMVDAVIDSLGERRGK